LADFKAAQLRVVLWRDFKVFGFWYLFFYLSNPGNRTNKIHSVIYLCVCLFFFRLFVVFIHLLFQSRRGGNGINITNEINLFYVSSFLL